MTRTVKPGYRFFKCPDCNCEWKEYCRDAETLSGTICYNPECDDVYGALISPYKFEYGEEEE